MDRMPSLLSFWGGQADGSASASNTDEPGARLRGVVGPDARRQPVGPRLEHLAEPNARDGLHDDRAGRSGVQGDGDLDRAAPLRGELHVGRATPRERGEVNHGGAIARKDTVELEA